MTGIRDVLEGGIFAFIVGTSKVRFEVHTKLVSDTSKVLCKLMTNNMLTESLTQTATLDDIEPDTFANFAEYLYKGTYGTVPDAIKPMYDAPKGSEYSGLLREDLMSKGYHSCYCNRCGKNRGKIELSAAAGFPLCDRRCIGMYGSTGGSYCVLCGEGNWSDPTTVFCQACEPLYRATKIVSGCLPSGELRWEDFKIRKIGTLDKTSADLHIRLTALSPSNSKPRDLLSHAKLYVFADRYMVDNLGDLCLYKLWRDLVAFELNDGGVGEICGCLNYAYENTAEETGSDKTGGNELRSLLMSYAACKVQDLAKDERFCTVLQGSTQILGDFMKATVQSGP